MVFNLGFDNSLWLILSSDSKYRFDIAEIIYNMPKELYDSIRNQLKEYNNDLYLIDYDVKCFKKVIIDNNGINSYYYVELDPCKIIIKLKRWNSALNKLNEDIELVLYSLNLFELDEYPVCLGKYNYNRSQFLNPFISLLSVISDNREYEICDNNDMMLDINLSDDMELNRKVNLKLLPNEIVVGDLKDRRSVKRLVRGRKK